MDLYCESLDSYRIVTTNPHTKKICFVCTKMNPDLFGFTNLNPKCFQKIWFVDSVCSDNFQKIRRILTNPHKSLVHKHTINRSESVWILGFRFVNPCSEQKIHFRDSIWYAAFKNSSWGFDSVYSFQKIHFGDSIWKAKILKRLCSFQFVRIRPRIPQS
jgi:hypothetical protein